MGQILCIIGVRKPHPIDDCPRNFSTDSVTQKTANADTESAGCPDEIPFQNPCRSILSFGPFTVSITPKTKIADTEPLLCPDGIPIKDACESTHSLSLSTNLTPAVRSQSALQNLPIELILEIAKSLGPVPSVALNYTCRYFSRVLSPSAATQDFKVQLRSARLEESFKLCVPPYNAERLAQRLELLSLLDRDGFLSPTTSICSGCAKIHDKSSFSSESLMQPSCERQCLGLTGRVWICPHTTLNYEQINTEEEYPYKRCPKPYGLCKHCAITVDTHRFSSEISFPFFHVPPEADPWGTQAAAALANLDLQMCPHMRLRDAPLSNLYASNCWWGPTLMYPCSCDVCSRINRGGRCAVCAAAARFYVTKSSDDCRTLWVIIQRRFEEECIDSQRWNDRISQPNACNAMEAGWNQTEDVAQQIIARMGECPHKPMGECCYRSAARAKYSSFRHRLHMQYGGWIE